MRFEMSKGPDGRWVVGCVPGATYTCTVDSKDEKSAVQAARGRKLRESKGLANVESEACIDPTWQYCLPKSYVPLNRLTAEMLGCTFYVGKACSHHPLNHVRYTSNRHCPICVVERDKGIRAIGEPS